jgi:hypothetical protein
LSEKNEHHLWGRRIGWDSNTIGLLPIGLLPTGLDLNDEKRGKVTKNDGLAVLS